VPGVTTNNPDSGLCNNIDSCSQDAAYTCDDDCDVGAAFTDRAAPLLGLDCVCSAGFDETLIVLALALLVLLLALLFRTLRGYFNENDGPQLSTVRVPGEIQRIRLVRGSSSLWTLAFVALVACFLVAPVQSSSSCPGPELMLSVGFSGDDLAKDMIEHSLDNGFALLGQSDSVGAGMGDLVLIKTNKAGGLMWTKSYGTAKTEQGAALMEYTVDKGFVLAGKIFQGGANLDIIITRTNSVGTEQWTRSYGGSEQDLPYTLIQSNDNAIVVGGTTKSYGNPGVNDTDAHQFLMKLNSAGTVQWSKIYAGASSYSGGEVAIFQHSVDNGYVMCGISITGGYGSSDFSCTKTNSAGADVWSRIYGGSSNDIVNGVSECSSDNGLAIVGTTSSWGKCVCVFACVFVSMFI
jgi:hypothetical protein